MVGSRVRAVVPASAANCGPGFDVVAVALALYNEIEMVETATGTVEVQIEGEGAETLPRDEQNVVVRAARLVYETVGQPLYGLRVRQVNGIPPGRGLGSSAAAWLGGMLAANALCGERLSRPRVMELAVAQEGHPDNLGAALAGGLTVTCWDAEARVVVPLPVPPSVRFALLVPRQEASTRVARAALPPTYSRADAVYNLGRTALLLAAFARERWEHLDAAMGDRMHQPYRARSLFPWLPEVFRAAREAGAAGVALSGAGPSVLAVVAGNDAGLAAQVAQAMVQVASKAGVEGDGMVLLADRQGARVAQLSD